MKNFFKLTKFKWAFIGCYFILLVVLFNWHGYGFFYLRGLLTQILVWPIAYFSYFSIKILSFIYPNLAEMNVSIRTPILLLDWVMMIIYVYFAAGIFEYLFIKKFKISLSKRNENF